MAVQEAFLYKSSRVVIRFHDHVTIEFGAQSIIQKLERGVIVGTQSVSHTGHGRVQFFALRVFTSCPLPNSGERGDYSLYRPLLRLPKSF